MLVNSRIKEITQHSRHSLPLGLAYIGAVLRQARFEVAAIDLNITPLDDSQVKRTIDKLSPRILAVSTDTATYLSGIKFIKLAREIKPDIKVIIGGPHASVLYREVANENGIDAVAIGEGEQTMLEIVEYWVRGKGDLADIKGIAYKSDGIIRVTSKRPAIDNPDRLPLPARDLFNISQYLWPNEILASRGGCPFACRFCAVNNIWEGKRRYRNPEKVVQEYIGVAGKYSTKQTQRISFADDTFSLDKDKTLALCKSMICSMETFPLFWKCSTRVDLIDKNLLKNMYLAGCRNIMYGIEAGSQIILNSIGKRITLDQIKKIVSLTLDSGISVHCSFMFPFPEDTELTIKEQTRFMKELSAMGADESIALTTPFPGPYFYNNAEKLGLNILSQDWDDYDCRHLVISTKNLSEGKLKFLWQEMAQEIGGYDVPAQKL